MPRNPFGTIYKHKVKTAESKTVIVFDALKRYTDREGRPGRKFKRCYSRGEASAQLLRFQSEIESELAAPANPEHVFSELVDFYLENYVKPAVFRDGQKIAGFRKNLTNIKANLELLRSFFGDTPLKQITYSQVYDFKVIYSGSDTSRGTLPAVSTINEKLSFLRRLLYIAIQKRWLDVHPFRHGDPLIKKAAEAKRNRMMTFEEEARLLAACDNDLRRHLIPLIVCAVDTAMRRSEIFRLEWHQIDFDNRVIYIKEGAERSKTGAGGVLPMSDRLYDILSGLANTGIPGNSVFPRFEYKRAWRSACKEAGISDLQFRDLRSTGATRMVLAGNPESQVMKVTRHRNLRIFLDHYSNVDILNARRIGENLTKFQQKYAVKSSASTNQKAVRNFKRR